MKKTDFLKIMIVISAIFMVSCEMFIPDPIDPRLSRYTEDGRDVSSALINDNAWIVKGETSFKFGYFPNHYITYQPENDTLFVEFNSDTNIGFVLVGYGITQVKDLNMLHNKKISINGENFYAIYGGKKADNGQIYFKNVISNDSSAILSGTFGFTLSDPPTKVSYGRFDFTIKKERNFHVKSDLP